jgi:hypothetical protein
MVVEVIEIATADVVVGGDVIGYGETPDGRPIMIVEHNAFGTHQRYGILLPTAGDHVSITRRAYNPESGGDYELYHVMRRPAKAPQVPQA